MSDDRHQVHQGDHPHVHFPGCGHETRRHEDHDDFEHDGHWHAKDGDHYDEHEAVGQTDTATGRG